MTDENVAASDEASFFQQMATCEDAYHRLADCIDAAIGYGWTFALTAIDLGAGLGFVADRLNSVRWRVLATDASAVAISMMAPHIPSARLSVTDSQAFEWLRTVDVAICTETAEHIAEADADAIVENVSGIASHYIVWSAAQPGQEWSGHINLQPVDYWLAKFLVHGWEPDAPLTDDLRRRMREVHAQHEYAADNFFILRKIGASE